MRGCRRRRRAASSDDLFPDTEPSGNRGLIDNLFPPPKRRTPEPAPPPDDHSLLDAIQQSLADSAARRGAPAPAAPDAPDDQALLTSIQDALKDSEGAPHSSPVAVARGRRPRHVADDAARLSTRGPVADGGKARRHSGIRRRHSPAREHHAAAADTRSWRRLRRCRIRLRRRVGSRPATSCRIRAIRASGRQPRRRWPDRWTCRRCRRRRHATCPRRTRCCARSTPKSSAPCRPGTNRAGQHIDLLRPPPCENADGSIAHRAVGSASTKTARKFSSRPSSAIAWFSNKEAVAEYHRTGKHLGMFEDARRGHRLRREIARRLCERRARRARLSNALRPRCPFCGPVRSRPRPSKSRSRSSALGSVIMFNKARRDAGGGAPIERLPVVPATTLATTREPHPPELAAAKPVPRGPMDITKNVGRGYPRASWQFNAQLWARCGRPATPWGSRLSRTLRSGRNTKRR